MPFAGMSKSQFEQQVQSMASAILNLLFPARCVACGSFGADLCEYCASRMIAVREPVCERCGESVDHEGLCSRCKALVASYDRIRSAFQFDDVVREAIHGLKYKRRKALAGILAYQATDKLERPPYDAILCALPLHATRLAERGFNQSKLLADHLGRIWNLPVLADFAVTRIVYSAPQAGSDLMARRANVAGAFKAESVEVGGKNIWLVDDVCTTTATLDSCARALRDAGARHIEAITIARA